MSALLIACAAPPAGQAPPVAPALEAPAEETGPGGPTRLELATVAADLNEPWGMDFLPDGSLLVTEKHGALKRIRPDGGSVETISGVPPVAVAGQGGLLDVLVHPGFETNEWVYLSYSVAGTEGYSTRVSRARLRGGELTGLEVLLTALPYFPERRHFGSRLLLDDGDLYVTIGDRGNRDLAQDLGTHNGKVLRLREDGSVPADNPFVDKSGSRPEIWTYGHRNPQGMARHPRSGAIWITEHGPQGGDELNELAPGNNYGWPLVTYGEEYGGGRIGEGTHRAGTQQPLVYWVPSIGTAGIDFYTGERYPGWQPSLLVSGLKLTRISRLELSEEGVGRETRLLANLDLRVRDLQMGPDGRLYVLAGDRLLRMRVAEGRGE